MRIFLSYASEDRALAEPIHLALLAQRHDVFFDREDLPPGEEYDIRIRRAIERAHLFIFLITPDALSEDSYTRTELSIALQRWKHPTGKLLPVMVRRVPIDALPATLRSVTLLDPEGNVPAAVSAAVHRLRRDRRRHKAVRAGGATLAAGALAAAGYALATRAPALEVRGRDGAPAVLVEAGTFPMGDNENSPLRRVYVDAFYIDRHEVTVALYLRFLEAIGRTELVDALRASSNDDTDDLPAVGVTWFDANEYCRWAGRRLPTESEWEKAARGGDGRRYPWGNEEPTSNRAVFLRSAPSPYEGGLGPVGSHHEGRSPYGAEDMAGNAAEWVADWYDEGFATGDVHNPLGPKDGTAKVIRGGSWQEPEFRLLSARRMYASPQNEFEDTGFRCARSLTPSGS